jgi:hypothetical protein
MVEYIPSYSAPALHEGLLPASRLASRKILIEQKIQKRTGPALCVLCGSDSWQSGGGASAIAGGGGGQTIQKERESEKNAADHLLEQFRTTER